LFDVDETVLLAGLLMQRVSKPVELVLILLVVAGLGVLNASAATI
jgi:hypothetical protein